MTRITRFSEGFWSPEFTNTTGFDILLKRMKEGKQMCKDVEDFLKSRAKLEEEYGRGLQKLIKNAGGTSEIGSLRISWDILKQETEKVAHEHFVCAHGFMDAARRISDFSERQKSERKAEEEITRRSMKKKHDLHNRTMNAKKAYETACRELEQIEDRLNTTVSTSSTKEYEKLNQKRVKLETDKKRSDSIYRSMVDTLEEGRQQWEKDMSNLCEAFQRLEEERICFLRNEMWVHANVVSQTCVDDDQHCEEVRKSLEECDIEQDIIQFINSRNTGFQRPQPIRYESWAQPNASHKFHTMAARSTAMEPQHNRKGHSLDSASAAYMEGYSGVRSSHVYEDIAQ